MILAIFGKINEALVGFISGCSKVAGIRFAGILGNSTLNPFVARIASALSMFALGSEASAKLKYSFLALGVSESSDAFA